MDTPAQTVPPLFSPDFLRDPYPTYRYHLAGPAVQHLGVRSNTLAVFRYDVCLSVLRNPSMSSVRPPQAIVAVPDAERAEFADFVDHTRRWLLFLDSPRHSRLRKLMNRGFAPLTVEKLRARVESAVGHLLHSAEAQGQFDLIRDFAYPLPVRIISELLGLPESLYDRCIALSTDIADWLGNIRRNAEDARRAQTAVQELTGYFEAVIRERDSRQHEDLLHLLLEIARSEPDISVEDIYAQCILLLVAGHETTRNLIGNAVYTLLTHPEAMSELRAQPALVSAVVEEVLRFEGPVQAIGRMVARDQEIEGIPVPAGASITIVLGAAHRDPAQFEHADRFDIHRKHLRHMAFGADAHVCLGSTLARLEGEVAIAALVRRFPALQMRGQQPDWGTNFAFRGLRTFPVSSA